VDDGSRFVGVQVLSPTAGTDTGVFDMPEPSATGDKWSLTERRDRDIMAVVAMLAGARLPMVLGFLYPQVNGMLFADKNRRVMRHASDVYTSIDGAGNVELAHPNGTYIRIGTSPAHEDLTGQDFDGNWAITKNTGAATHLQVVLKSGGTQKAKLHIDPSGNVELEHTGNLSINTSGNLSATVGGTSVVTSSGAVTVHAPSVTIDAPSTTCTGALTVQGLLTYQAGLTGSGGSGASLNGNFTLTGNFTSTGSMTNNGKAVGSTLRVTGVSTGGGVSGNPV
jgi:phage baseplate assembly protein gpV